MNRNELEQQLVGMIGLPLWGIKKGFGTFLTFEVGNLDPTRSKSGIDHGEWHIWVRMGFWRVIQDSRVVVSALMDAEEQKDGMSNSAIHDKRWTISTIALGKTFNDISLECVEGLRIDICFASSAADDEQWTIFKPDQQAISAYGDGTISVGK